MAHQGLGFFNAKGQYFKTPDEATASDLSSMLGKIGEGDSLAPGIALMLLEKRAEIERIFAEHDEMVAERTAHEAKLSGDADNVTALPGVDRSEAS
ncbi:hypothetical protein [Pontixanthobacter aquaemixtae]|uniref:Uncharacterized protein n=1 Tax=Pontixanthobacter aquaemixtae TaxID=1958940 RepID=A0A844ZRV7_9SPHN|nr:hypothetical protein [Pontixanthobacter aquaemixtae]MXO90052.1 hypothetical protein [Pontixanthobacter aquaemixtae]